MAFTIVPGPLVGDGTRINPDLTLVPFVQGTTIEGFGTAAFVGATITFIHSATEPPGASLLHRGFRWFKRGEGVTYRWDVLSQSGVSEGRWVASSNRKELVVFAKRPFSANEVVWIHTDKNADPTYKFRAIDFDRHVVECANTQVTNHAMNHPPYFVATTDAASGTFQTVLELGYYDVVTHTAATGPAFACVGTTDFDFRLLQFANPFTHTNAVLASIVQSAATNPTGKLKCFFWQNPSHLLKHAN